MRSKVEEKPTQRSGRSNLKKDKVVPKVEIKKAVVRENASRHRTYLLKGGEGRGGSSGPQ